MYRDMQPIIRAQIAGMAGEDNWEYNMHLGGHAYRFTFPNGYGMSAIKHHASYGNQEDLWEIAVLLNGSICETTEITDDTIGWLSDEQVLEYAKKIYRLERRNDNGN